MQLTPTQRYLIRTSKNVTFYFYSDNHREICLHTYNEENQFVKEERLVAQMVLDFSVTIDQKDQIHLICITKEGSLLYYIRQEDVWKHRMISKLDVRSNLYRYLQLMIVNGFTHILCAKTNLLNASIMSIEHIYWNEGSINRTTITTYVPGKYPSPYQVGIDSLFHIHLVYKVYHKTNHQLYHCKFNSVTRKWTPGELVSDLQEDHSHPYMLIDRNDNLHLLWCTIEGNNFTLKYKRKPHAVTAKSKWSGVKTLSNKNANHLSPILLQENQTLKLLSKQNNHIAELTSTDFGDSWSAFEKCTIYKTENPLLLQYDSTFDFDQTHHRVQHVYGEVKDEIITFGTKLYKSSVQNKTPLIPTEKELPDQVIDVEAPSADQIETNPVAPPMVEEVENEKILPALQEAIKPPITPSLSNDSKALIDVDEDLKLLVQEVQKSISLLASQVGKLEYFHKSDPIIQPTYTEEDLSIEKLAKDIQQLNEEKYELQQMLKESQQALFLLEERFVDFKKHLLSLEDRVKAMPNASSGFLSRLKNLLNG